MFMHLAALSLNCRRVLIHNKSGETELTVPSSLIKISKIDFKRKIYDVDLSKTDKGSLKKP